MKKIIISCFLILTIIQPSFSAGSSGDSGASKTDYEKAVKVISNFDKI